MNLEAIQQNPLKHIFMYSIPAIIAMLLSSFVTIADGLFVVKAVGKEALAAIEKHTPTMVISDIVMPEMNGYELCQQIKTDERLREIPVILLTSLSDPQDIIRGMESGANNFIVK